MDKNLNTLHIKKYARYFVIASNKFATTNEEEDKFINEYLKSTEFNDLVQKLEKQRKRQESKTKVKCPKCKGWGSIGNYLDSPSCSLCEGSGFVEPHEKLEYLRKFAEKDVQQEKESAIVNAVDNFLNQLKKQRSNIDFQSKKICPECEGVGSAGEYLDSPECETCNGDGFIDKNQDETDYMNDKEIPIDPEAEELEKDYFNEMEDFGKY